MNKIYIGIDHSMTSTGLVAIDNEYNLISSQIIKSDKNDENHTRIKNIGNQIIFELLKYEKDDLFCCLEGISFGSQGKAVIQQGSLHNYIRIVLDEYDINHIICTPTELKKFVTGKGQCKKELMLMKIYKRWNIEFEITDLADAYALARFCKEFDMKE